MPSLNRVYLVGHLGRAPELRYTEAGKAMAVLSVATTDRWTDAAGATQERTEWHRVIVWGATAEAAAGALEKGALVMIEGAIRSRQYDAKDGQPRRITEIAASRVIWGRAAAAGHATTTGDTSTDDVPF